MNLVSDRFSVADVSLKDMAVSMRRLREIGRASSSMEDVAGKTVRYFYESAVDPQSNEKELSLVRFYKTHDYGRLPPEQREFVDRKFPQYSMTEQSQCLVLLGTAGEKEQWNSIHTSQGHKAVPLPTAEAVRDLPMIAAVISSLGYDLEKVLAPEPGLIIAEEPHSFNVFYVPKALGSPHIPAQSDYVVPMGIKSVLGFGGMLPSGSLFVLIMFSKREIPQSTAAIFKSLGVSVKVSIVMFDETAVFEAN